MAKRNLRHESPRPKKHKARPRYPRSFSAPARRQALTLAIVAAAAFTSGCRDAQVADGVPGPFEPAAQPTITASPQPTPVLPAGAVAAPFEEQPPPPVVDAKQGIGPIKLGMTVDQIIALKLPIKGINQSMEQVGPYLVSYTDGKVDFVEVRLARLPNGIRIGKTVVPPTEKSIEKIAKLFSSCTKVEHRIGGSSIPCQQGRIRVGAAGPPGVVVIQVHATPAK